MSIEFFVVVNDQDLDFDNHHHDDNESNYNNKLCVDNQLIDTQPDGDTHV